MNFPRANIPRMRYGYKVNKKRWLPKRCKRCEMRHCVCFNEIDEDLYFMRLKDENHESLYYECRSDDQSNNVGERQNTTQKSIHITVRENESDNSESSNYLSRIINSILTRFIKIKKYMVD